jgi:aminocarboxymuconate-semialdehyde decarboxylase
MPQEWPAMTNAIDIHTHIVPRDLPAYTGRAGTAAWPSLRPAGCGHAEVIIKDRVFRKITKDCWDIDERLEGMAKMGIGRQVLSPMPKLLSYDFAEDDTADLGKYINGVIAEMVATAPNAMFGLGMVTLQNPERAARELEDVRAMGLRGVEIGTNINGRVIGKREFDPFFAAAEELGMSVFIHPLEPIGVDRLVGPDLLGAVIAFPCETAFALASLITGGLLERRPALRLAASHGGGTFAMVEPRMTHAWGQLSSLKELATSSPRELAKRIYYDGLVYDTEILALLIKRFGVDRLMVGTDFPFDIYERDPISRLDALGLSAHEMDQCNFLNAERFLGL